MESPDESRIRKNYKRKNIKLNSSLTTALKGINFRRTNREKTSNDGMDLVDVSYLLSIKRINGLSVRSELFRLQLHSWNSNLDPTGERIPRIRKCFDNFCQKLRSEEHQDIVYEVSKEFVAIRLNTTRTSQYISLVSFHSFVPLTSTPAYLEPEGFSQLSFSHAYKLQYEF